MSSGGNRHAVAHGRGGSMGGARAGYTLPGLQLLAAGRGGGAGRPPPPAEVVLPIGPQRVF